VEAPPFAGRGSHSPERPSTSYREKRREIIHEKDRSTRRKQPQVEEDVEALPRHPEEKKTPSEVSP
jgi:hypothetical protein